MPLLLFLILCLVGGTADAMLAGGRPNTISGGHNAFAGVVNPASAVWIEDRFDFGFQGIYQKSSLDNLDNNPLFPPGKTDLTYKTNYLTTYDGAINKRFKVKGYDCSFSLATYTTPGYLKLQTKVPFPLLGNTPLFIENKTQAASAIFGWKINKQHSIGFSLDYFVLNHCRNGFQNADNPIRSVSPGNVTNNGMDYSNGVGLGLGWIYNISKPLTFGFAYVKKSYVGQFRKYRGYEPYHAKNYIPQTIGGGFTYRFDQKTAGRLEVLWTGYGNLPNANNTFLSNGMPNLNKRGSDKSAGSGLQNATFLNMGLGHKFNSMLSMGLGWSHRFKRSRNSPYIISHNYIRQTIYDIVTLGVNFRYSKNDFFLTMSHGFQNRQTGYMPEAIGGGKFVSLKNFDSLSIAWGYLY